MTPLTVTPQSPAPLTLTVRSPRLGVACRHSEGPATLRGTPARWRIDFGAAPVPAVPAVLLTAPLGSLTATMAATIPFNPVTAVGWTAAYWAEGTEWAALSVADGALVASIPDEKSTYDLAQAADGSKPTYRATGGPNSLPCWEADGGDVITRSTTPSWTGNPYTFVAVGKYDNADTNIRTLMSSSSVAGAVYTSTTWQAYGGNVVNTGDNDDANWHLFTVFFNRNVGDTVFELDGTNIGQGAGGNDSASGFTLFNAPGFSRFWDGKAAFAGAYVGDARTDGGWANFEQWVEDHYGITIA